MNPGRGENKQTKSTLIIKKKKNGNKEMTGIIIHPHRYTVANQNTAIATVREVFQITCQNQRVAVNTFFGGLSIKVSQKQLER